MLQNEVQLHNIFLCHETEFLLKQQFLLQAEQGGGNAKETKEGLNVLIFFDNL